MKPLRMCSGLQSGRRRRAARVACFRAVRRGGGAPDGGTTVASAPGVRARRGFTLLELMIAVAIVAILAALAVPTIVRQRPRARLQGAAADLAGLLRGARQNALSTGLDTVVMVFPQEPNGESGIGRIVVREDATHDFFSTTAATNFAGYSAESRGDDREALLGTLELPRGIIVGLAGQAAPTLDAPYSAITTGACTFCGSGPGGRGAIVFDSRGRARFHTGNAAALEVFGGTIALQAAPEVAGGAPVIDGYRLLVITAATGSVRALDNG
jgi:prepilin-type N-terminal cleavage/methylation domain-containing protein